MFLSKYLILFTAIVVSSAAPSVRRQESTGPLCHYVVTPASFPGEIGLDTDLNYALGRTLAEETPNQLGIINHGCTVDGPQDDGTYNVDSRIAAVGSTDAETAALIEDWPGKVVQGSPLNGSILWTINAVHCDVNAV